ncbi:hypothetical protein [Lentzea sp. NPDC051838]|uniref:hypothetical protein n=1 Tax=Lentzea sp. NPDC051838 TaxID=3154849 RepID=UPI00341503AA
MNRHPATPQLRDLATVDARTVLVASDFVKPFTKAPEPLNSPLSCRWTTEDNTIWMSVENESLEEAKPRVNDGSDLPVEGHKAWWGVTSDSRTPPRYDIGSVARTRTVAILQKLFS